MEHVVVKTEMQTEDEILFFYIDEGGDHIPAEVSNVKNENLLQEDNEIGIITQDYEIETPRAYQEDLGHGWLPPNKADKNSWTDDDTKKLLVFYIDNKESFRTGKRKNNLWTVACKAILHGKNPALCETKLASLRELYCQHSKKSKTEGFIDTDIYELCKKAFVDEFSVDTNQINQENKNNNGVLSLKKTYNRSVADEQIVQMLKLYQKFKKQNISLKNIWTAIGTELGKDGDEISYLQKRFLNYKQHYLKLLEKRSLGETNINWPYISLFDEIYKDDIEFQRKYNFKNLNEVSTQDMEWDDTERTVLAKYYFDCFDEFIDVTLPDKFLWNEIGRLIAKNPEDCKAKYHALKEEHTQKILNDDYNLMSRIPLEIIFDNIISREMQIELSKENIYYNNLWKLDETTELVQFIYSKVELFKDPVCYYVCWYAISKKFDRHVLLSKKQWENLVTDYKTILDYKKENPETQIEWDFMDLFDRIFDFGTDVKLMEGYEKSLKLMTMKEGSKVSKNRQNLEKELEEDEVTYDERGFVKRSKRGVANSKVIKILDFYQENKDELSSNKRNKHEIWSVLAKEIGIPAEECAHRLRNLKQVYIGYISREIKKPETPILWPYYSQCKKVFGYRTIKSKLKSSKKMDEEEWEEEEIEQLINYYAQHENEMGGIVELDGRWISLSEDLEKSPRSCWTKFIDLRKTYRKLKTMKSRNPDVKVSWQYFNMMDEIFDPSGNTSKDESMDVDNVYQQVPIDELPDDIRKKLQEDDDLQCIILIPEGGNESNAQIIIQKKSSSDNAPKVSKWTKKSKKRLLILYLKYIKQHKDEKIKSSDMWQEISLKLNKPAISCRKIFAVIKKNYLELMKKENPDDNKTPYHSIMKKIIQLNPTFAKIPVEDALKKTKKFKNSIMPADKVEKALKYYLENLEEFVTEKYEKKYVWTELAKYLGEGVIKVFNKINFLKLNFNLETEEIAGERHPEITGLLKEIIAKENYLKDDDSNEHMPVIYEEEISWSEEEIELLLTWYLANLQKFKNPKYMRSYLWNEASFVLKKSPVSCSTKMSEIRTEYRNKVRENPDELSSWRFYELCQKIYGTGKKRSPE